MGVKYIAEWVDEKDIAQKLEISLPDYSDDPIDFSDDPKFQAEFNVRWNESPENIKGIGVYSSTASLMAVGDGTTIDLVELALMEDRDVIATYYKDGVVNWKGYCIPDSIVWDLDGEPYNYAINFTDGLNLLDKLPVFVLNLDPPAGANVRCPLNWFRGILNASVNLGISLPIEWCMTSLSNSKWFDQDVFGGSVMWGQDERSFLYYNENPNITRYRSCHYIIRNMLVSMHARLFQQNGKWHIERIPDIATGEYTIFEVPASLSGVPEITETEVDVNRVLGEDGWPTTNVASLTVKKGLRSVVVKYEHNQSENIWPNGNMNVDSLGSVLYWTRYPAPTGSTLVRRGTITQRGENSILVENANTGGLYAGLTIVNDGKYTVPIDAHTLYTRFKWGFTFLPTFWEVDDDGFIKWDDSPLKAKVSFKIPKSGGGTRNLVLNEYGFWSADTSGGTRLDIFYDEFSTSGGTFEFVMRINGIPVAGDLIKTFIYFQVEQQYFVNASEQGDLETFLDNFVASILAHHSSYSATILPFIDGIHDGAYQVTITGDADHRVTNTALFLTDAITPDGTIRFKVDKMMVGDVATISFQSKTLNEGWILFPDPGELNGTLATGVSELQIELQIQPDQQNRFQDIYVQLDENHDVYEAVISGSRNTASEEITTEISSQFTGAIPSNYQTHFTRSNEQFKFTDGHGNWSLTRVLAESILRYNSKPAIVVQDLSFYCDDGDFGFGQIFTVPSFEGKKFLTLAAEYNNQTRVATITACEIAEDTESGISTNHYGNNEYANSN